MKQKKPTFSVAVSAYNEEESIVPFLESVLSQRINNLAFEKILVVSDGSTDKTVERAKSLKSPLIEVRDYKERVGKATRLNEIYSSLNSDFLVQTDGDVLLMDVYTIENIVGPMLSDSRVGMCGGNLHPLPPKNFTERGVNSMYRLCIKVRKEVREGNNVFSATGGLLAYRKGLYKKMSIPVDMISNDVFTYYLALSFGYRYRFVEEVVYYFRLPQTIFDHIKQYLRAAATPRRLLRYFPKDLVSQEGHIPKQIIARIMFVEAIKNPLGFTYIFLVNKYVQIKARAIERKLNAKWDMAYTTKKLK